MSYAPAIISSQWSDNISTSTSTWLNWCSNTETVNTNREFKMYLIHMQQEAFLCYEETLVLFVLSAIKMSNVASGLVFPAPGPGHCPAGDPWLKGPPVHVDVWQGSQIILPPQTYALSQTINWKIWAWCLLPLTVTDNKSPYICATLWSVGQGWALLFLITSVYPQNAVHTYSLPNKKIKYLKCIFELNLKEPTGLCLLTSSSVWNFMQYLDESHNFKFIFYLILIQIPHLLQSDVCGVFCSARGCL